jgi:hypothetical protein
MNNPNVVEEGARTRFTNANQPANRGRKRSALKKFVKDNGISIQDVRLVFQNIIVKKLSEVRKLKDDADELPAIVGFTVSALLKDYDGGKLDTFNILLDRIWGKPLQLLEMSAPGNDIPDDPDERRALAEKLRVELSWAYPTQAISEPARESPGKAAAPPLKGDRHE